MATSGILTSLMSRYIDVNNLKSKNQNGRFMFDDNMKTHFTSTEYLFPKYKKDGTFTKTIMNLGEREIKNISTERAKKNKG